HRRPEPRLRQALAGAVAVARLGRRRRRRRHGRGPRPARPRPLRRQPGARAGRVRTADGSGAADGARPRADRARIGLPTPLKSPTQALLVLEDGSVFEGESVAPGTRFGEVVFNTSMTGYQEVLTDPSYPGQIVLITTSTI